MEISVFHFHGHFQRDGYKPKGLELVLVQKADATYIFRLEIPFGEGQISLSIYIPTEISGFFGLTENNRGIPGTSPQDQAPFCELPIFDKKGI